MDNKSNTSTHIRNLYSEGMSYLNIKFYNTNLSLQFVPFVSKDASGHSTFNQAKYLMTTVNWESAGALYKTAEDIIYGRINEVLLVIPCTEASLVFERRPGQNGQMETLLIIQKNNETIPFRFKATSYQTRENGQNTNKTVEHGLIAFAMTLNGYLTGINADRHLNKMTDDYIKSLGDKSQPQNFQTGSGYQKGNQGFKPKWQGGKKNYGGGGNYQGQQSWENNQPQNQDFSNYSVPA